MRKRKELRRIALTIARSKKAKAASIISALPDHARRGLTPVFLGYAFETCCR
jgi:hypothetical protein